MPLIEHDFDTIQDCPPERWSHEAAVAIQDAIDECNFKHDVEFVLKIAKQILEERANDL